MFSIKFNSGEKYKATNYEEVERIVYRKLNNTLFSLTGIPEYIEAASWAEVACIGEKQEYDDFTIEFLDD